MLTERELKLIGKRKCVDLFGKEFVKKHKDTACDCWGNKGGKFRYWIGLSDEPDLDDKTLCAGETPYKYYIDMLIDRKTGDVAVTKIALP